MRVALYQPDIPQNTGAILRLGACFGVAVDIIEPCGFLWDDRRLQRAGMDYLELASVTRYRSWADFLDHRPLGRLVLLTTRGSMSLPDFTFASDDILLFGRESAGVPGEVHDAVAARVRIPMRPDVRSLNLALTAALTLGEALRQTKGFPEEAEGFP